MACRRAGFEYKTNVITLRWDLTSLLVADIVTIVVLDLLFLNKSCVELVVHHQRSAWANTTIEV